MNSEMISKENPFVMGRNWGNINFGYNKIEFLGNDKYWFSIPFNSVSNVQQASNKNEVALELNIDDEKSQDFMLCEMRLFVPEQNESKEKKEEENEENEESEREEQKTAATLLKEEIIRIANIGTVSDSIAKIQEITMITPRGKFDIYFMKNFIKIHGQTHNYKILNKHINKVFLVPKNDGHNHYLIVSLSSPINQGNTSYPFLIFQLKEDANSTIELNIPKEMNINLPNPLVGSVKDNIAQLFIEIVQIGIIVPSKNYTFSKGPYLKCSYKANEGILYPLEKCFLFVHKPVICVNHEDIRQMECARIHDSNLQQRTFDIKIVTRKAEEIQFIGLEKGEHDLILKYCEGKKIKVNNIDEKNNVIEAQPTTLSKRQRSPVDEEPMELPSEESLVGDDDYSSEDEDDDEDEVEEDEEDKRKKHKHKHSKHSHKKKHNTHK